MSVFLPRRWRSQPQYPVAPENNAFANELRILSTPTIGPEWFSKFTPILGSGASVSPTPQGKAFASSSANFGGTTIYQAPDAIIARGFFGALPDFTGPWSIFVRVYLQTVADNQVLFGDADPAGNGWTIVMRAQAASWLLNTQAYTWATSGGTPTVGWHDVEVESTGGASSYTQYLYVDGVEIGNTTSSNALQVKGGDGSPQCKVNSWGGYNASGTGSIPLFALWSRRRSAAERAEFRVNPWQLFAPLPRRIYVGPSAGAGAPQSITVPAAAVTVAVNAPTVSRTTNTNPVAITVPAAAVTVASPAPTVSRTTNTNPVSVTVPAAAVTVAAAAPTVTQLGPGANQVTVPAAPVVVAAAAPVVSRTTNTNPRSITVPAAAVTVAAAAPTITQTAAVYVSVGTADVLVRGLAPSITVTGIVVTPESQVGGGGRRKAPRRRRVIVEIDGEEFEVASEQQGMELLLRARELAAEKAQADAAKAATKAATKSKPAAQNRALAVPIPQVRLVSPDMGDELAQQMQASVDATNAYFEQVYGQALSVARRRVVEMLQDEEDAITVLLLG